MQFNEQKQDYMNSLSELQEGTEEYEKTLLECHRRGAQRCVQVANQHRGLYVKAAQFIASIRGGTGDRGVPKPYTDALQGFTDHAPHKSIQEVSAAIQRKLDRWVNHSKPRETLVKTNRKLTKWLRNQRLGGPPRLDEPGLVALRAFGPRLRPAVHRGGADGLSLAGAGAPGGAPGRHPGGGEPRRPISLPARPSGWGFEPSRAVPGAVRWRGLRKVQYPELRKEMSSDFAVFKTMGAQIKQMAAGYDLMWVVEAMVCKVSQRCTLRT